MTKQKGSTGVKGSELEAVKKGVSRVTAAEAFYAGTLLAFMDAADDLRIALEAANGDQWAQTVTAFMEGCTPEGLEQASLSVLDAEGNAVVPLIKRGAYTSAKSTYKNAVANGVPLVDADGKVRSKTLVGAESLAKAAGVDLKNEDGTPKKVAQLNKERKELAEAEELNDAPISAPFREATDEQIARVFFARCAARNDDAEEVLRARDLRAAVRQDCRTLLGKADAEEAENAVQRAASEAKARHAAAVLAANAEEDKAKRAAAIVAAKADLHAEYAAAGYTVTPDELLVLAADELDSASLPDGAIDAMQDQQRQAA